MSPTVEIMSSGAGSMRLNVPLRHSQPYPVRPMTSNATPPTVPCSSSANACDVTAPGGSSVVHVVPRRTKARRSTGFSVVRLAGAKEPTTSPRALERTAPVPPSV